jgi:hypothetical protein
MPASLLDAPAEGQVVDLVDDVAIQDPSAFVRQFNAASLDDGGARWAAIARTSPKIGAVVELAGPG